MGHRFQFNSRQDYDDLREHSGSNRRIGNIESHEISTSNERQGLFQKSVSHRNVQQQVFKPLQMTNDTGHLQTFQQNSVLPNTGQQHYQLQQSPVLSNHGQLDNQPQPIPIPNTNQQYYQFQQNVNTGQDYNQFHQNPVLPNAGQQLTQLQHNPALADTGQQYNQVLHSQALANTGQYNQVLHSQVLANTGQQYNQFQNNPVLPNSDQQPKQLQQYQPLANTGQGYNQFHQNPVLANTGHYNQLPQAQVLANTGQQYNLALPDSGQQCNQLQQNPVLPNTGLHILQQNPVLANTGPQYNQMKQNLLIPYSGQQHSQLQQSSTSVITDEHRSNQYQQNTSTASFQSNKLPQNPMLEFGKQPQFQIPVIGNLGNSQFQQSLSQFDVSKPPPLFQQNGKLNDIGQSHSQFQNGKLINNATAQPQQFPMYSNGAEKHSPIRNQTSPMSSNAIQFSNQQDPKFRFGQSSQFNYKSVFHNESQFQSGLSLAWSNRQQPLSLNGLQHQVQSRPVSNDVRQQLKFKPSSVLSNGMQQSSFQPSLTLRNGPSSFEHPPMFNSALQQSKFQPNPMLANGLQQTKFQQQFNQQSNFQYIGRSMFNNTKRLGFRQKSPISKDRFNYQRQRASSVSPMKSNTSGFQNGGQMLRNQNSTPPFNFTLPHAYKPRFNLPSSQQNNNMDRRYTSKNKFPQKSQYDQQQSKINLKEMPFSCDTCDRAFAQESEMKKHLSDHIKCGIKGCKFEAHFKIVALHQRMQHETGYADAILKLDNDEEIEKWRNARRSRFPTAENIKKKKAEQSEKEARGEVIETKDFGKFKKPQNERHNFSQRRSRGRVQRNGFRNRRDNETNQRVESKKPIEEAKVVTVEESDSDDDSHIKLPRFKGLLSVPDQELSFNEEKCESEPSSIIEDEKLSSLSNDPENVEKNTASSVANINKKKTVGEQKQKSLQINRENISVSDEDCLDLSSSNECQIVNLDSDDAPSIAPIQNTNLIEETDKVLEINTDSTLSPSKEQAIQIEDSEDEGPTVEPIRKSVLNEGTDIVLEKDVESTSPSKEGVHEVKNQPNKRKQWSDGSSNKDDNDSKRQRFSRRQWIPPPKSTLLEKLLADDIRHERNVILQCVKHIVKNNFFDK